VAGAGLVVIALAGLLTWVAVGKGTSSTTIAPVPAGLTGKSMGSAEYDTIRESLEKVVGITAPIVTTSDQQRFVEGNTITFPSAVGSETLANAKTGQGFTEQQVMEFDALTAIAAVVPSPVITAEEQRFLEANTILPVAAPASYMEQVTPPPSQPR
jgi:hypothetical protein